MKGTHQKLLNELRSLRCSFIISRGKLDNEHDSKRLMDILAAAEDVNDFEQNIPKIHQWTRLLLKKFKDLPDISDALKVISIKKEIQLLNNAKQMLNSNLSHKKINVLCIDGGGSRGLIALKILQAIQRFSSMKIVDNFDVVYGVSTGAIIIALLFAMNLSVDDVINKYRVLNKQIWQRNSFVGMYSLFQKSAYYNSEFLSNQVNEIFKHNFMINTKIQNNAKIGILSLKCQYNTLKPYIFRNWLSTNDNLVQYDGSSLHKWIDAIKSSTAAPIIYEPYELNGFDHIDGGIYANNPSFIAYNDIKSFFPNYQIKNFVSIGTGIFDPLVVDDLSKIKIRDKPPLQKTIERVIKCATNVESIYLSESIESFIVNCSDIHKFMYELLPRRSYFRLNPRIPYQFPLNESKTESLIKMIKKSDEYIDQNRLLFQNIAKSLK